MSRLYYALHGITTASSPILVGFRWATARLLPSRLADINVPALVLDDATGPLFPIEHGESLAAEIPDASLAPLAGMGHQVPPSELWNVVVRAIIRHTSGDPPSLCSSSHPALAGIRSPAARVVRVARMAIGLPVTRTCCRCGERHRPDRSRPPTASGPDSGPA